MSTTVEQSPDPAFLIDGKYSITDLVDIDELQRILERFSKATGFTTGLVSYPDQQLLIVTGWRDICTKFHRACPESEPFCRKSNATLTAGLKQDRELNISHCEHGLVDGATPVIIKGVHVANLFMGQVLFQEPDLEDFRRRAERFGYDPQAYIAALQQVPVVTRKRLEDALAYLADMAVLLGELGLKNLQSLEVETECTRTLEHQRKLNRLRETLLEPGSLPEKLRLITDGVVEIFDADFCRVWIIKPGDRCDSDCIHARVTQGPHICRDQARCLHLTVSSGRYTHTDGEMHRRVPLGAYKIGLVATGQDEAFLVNDVARDQRVHNHDWIREYGLTSFAGYKLSDDAGRPVGVLALFSKHAITPGEHVLLENLVRTASQTIQAARAEEALRKSEMRFRDIAESMSDWVWEVNADAVFTHCSAKVESILGYRTEEIIGKTPFDLMPPDEAERAGAVFVEIARDKRSFRDLENWNLTKDGRRICLLTSGIPILADDGELLGYRGVDSNITDRKLAEEALRESEAKYRTFFDNSVDAMLMVEDNLFVDCNKAAVAMLGYDNKDEVIRRHPSELSPDVQPDGRRSQEKANEMIKIAADGGSHFFEWAHKRKDGSVFPVEVSVTAIRVKNKTMLHTIWRDISDRKRAEAERVRLISAIEQAAETILITDAEATIQYVNPAFERITGYTREEAIGQNPRILKSGAQNAEFYRELWDTLARGETWSGRLINKRKDGKLYTEEVTISPVQDASGKTVNYVAVKHDITEKIKLEEQLRQSQKMEAVGQLAGGVAHDFNNILTAIMGNVELSVDALQAKLGADDPLLQGLGQIQHSAERAAALTRQLLLFSRRDVAQPEVLDLNRTLVEMEKMLSRLITEDIMLKVMPAPNLRPVRADADQIEQVIMNLVVNACDAMPLGGMLTLETANVVLDSSYAAAHAEACAGAHVILAVSDTGRGMDDETRARIFEPFFTTKPVGQGTGLGLATVYAIIKRAGGHVMVYSESGQGTTFKIYLPVAEAPFEEGSVETIEIEAPIGDETILVCEDDEMVREMTVLMLRDAGYTAVAAEDGLEALKLAGDYDGEIQLLISDVIMPEINGKKLSDTLVAARPNLKTLYISGYTSNVIAHHGVLDEGVEFLEKPFSRRALLSRVREILDKSHAPR